MANTETQAALEKIEKSYQSIAAEVFYIRNNQDKALCIAMRALERISKANQYKAMQSIAKKAQEGINDSLNQTKA